MNDDIIPVLQKTVFKAQGKQKENNRIVGDISRDKSENDLNVETWDHVPIVVPSLTPSGLEHCTIIELSYALEVYLYAHVWSTVQYRAMKDE